MDQFGIHLIIILHLHNFNMKKLINKINNYWSNLENDNSVYGFQILKNTTWNNKAYTKQEIDFFEEQNKLLLPVDFVEFLLLITGIKNEQYDFKNNMFKQNWVFNISSIDKYKINTKFVNLLKKVGIFLDKDDILVRLYGYRFLVCNKNIKYKTSKILSIMS